MQAGTFKYCVFSEKGTVGKSLWVKESVKHVNPYTQDMNEQYEQKHTELQCFIYGLYILIKFQRK